MSIQWTDISVEEDAIEAKKANPLNDFSDVKDSEGSGWPVMIYFCSTNKLNAKNCKKIEKNILGNIKVVNLVKDHFNCYRIDTTDVDKKLLKKYKVTKIPTIMFFNSKGKKVKSFTKTNGSAKFIKLLNAVIKKCSKPMWKGDKNQSCKKCHP